MQQHPPPTTWYHHPQTSEYLPAPLFPQYPLAPPSPPPSSPSNCTDTSGQSQPNSKSKSKSKAKSEKHCAKRKAKKQRRGEKKKALHQAAAKADELALTLQRLGLGGSGTQTISRQKGQRERRDSARGVETPPILLFDEDRRGESSSGFEDGDDGSADGVSTSVSEHEDDDEDDECEPFFRAGTELKCCATHGKGCWRFPDLIAMKRYLPTWRKLRTGEEDVVLRKHSV